MGLDLVELVMELERTFDISLPIERVEQFRTVGQLFDLVCEQLTVRDPLISHAYVGPLWEQYLDIMEESLGVTRDQLKPDVHFVMDLGIDRS